MTTIKIDSCAECRECESSRYSTSDLFEFICKAKIVHGRHMRIALKDWNEGNPEVPNWCPKRVKE